MSEESSFGLDLLSDTQLLTTEHTGISVEMAQLARAGEKESTLESSQGMDINTPSEDYYELMELNNHIVYYNSMKEYCEQVKSVLEMKGKEGAREFLKNEKQPKKPDVNILKALKGEETKKKNTLHSLRGKELLRELKSMTRGSTMDGFSVCFDPSSNVETIKERLLICEQSFRGSKRQQLKIIAVYGGYLNILRNKHFGRFKSILIETIQIARSWANTLIKVSVVLQKYKQLQCVNLPVSKLSPLLKHIVHALDEFPEEREFWECHL
jgi:hypothetical protein